MSQENTAEPTENPDTETRRHLIQWVDLDSIKPNPNNPRKHSPRQIQNIAKNIEHFSFVNPIVVNGANVILAGQGRHEAARLLRLRQVPIIRLDGLTEKQARAYMLADNQLGIRSTWDTRKLGQELQALLDEEIAFDLELTGFESAEIDIHVQSLDNDDPDQQDEFEYSGEVPVTHVGDIWSLNGHRIVCGNALEQQYYATLLGSDRANALITDPPYNVRIHGHVRAKPNSRHREFVMASGEMSDSEFDHFLAEFFQNSLSFAAANALIYAFMDWGHMASMLLAGAKNNLDLINLCIWVKTNGGMGSLYRSRHELVFVFRNGRSGHINNIQLGRFGRNRTNVWEYAGANSFARRGRENDFESHPTVKPIKLIADAILDCTNRGNIVLDPFLGSGTTILAAEKTGRRGFGIELDPRYVDTAIKRWEKLTGGKAVNQDGQTFEEAKAIRSEGLEK